MGQAKLIGLVCRLILLLANESAAIILALEWTSFKIKSGCSL